MADMNELGGAILEDGPARVLEVRMARLAVRQAGLAALPTVVLYGGRIARLHKIKGAAHGKECAVAIGGWRAACGSAPGQVGSCSASLDEAVNRPRCPKKIAS